MASRSTTTCHLYRQLTRSIPDRPPGSSQAFFEGSRRDPRHSLGLIHLHYRATKTFDNALFLRFDHFWGVFSLANERNSLRSITLPVGASSEARGGGATGGNSKMKSELTRLCRPSRQVSHKITPYGRNNPFLRMHQLSSLQQYHQQKHHRYTDWERRNTDNRHGLRGSLASGKRQLA